MFGFFARFLTSVSWFFGTIIVVAIIVFLLWNWINPDGFTYFINNLIKKIYDWLIIIFSLGAVVALMFTGLRIILGYRPWWLGGGRRNNH